jgi:4'-phosphopantetheinyl transferase
MVWTVARLSDLAVIEVPESVVVYAFVSLGAELTADAVELLDDDESVRAGRFVHARDRRSFVNAHAALRLLVAHALGVATGQVAYTHGHNGKPALAPGLGSLRFNLAHSAEIGLVALARERSVGVDVEQLHELADALDVAEQNFSPAERAALLAVPSEERSHAFLRCWTRKEAVVKLDGEGIGAGLDSFDVDLSAGATSALLRYEDRDGREAPLTLRDLTAPPGYVAAGAAEVVPGDEVTWRELTSG